MIKTGRNKIKICERKIESVYFSENNNGIKTGNK